MSVKAALAKLAATAAGGAMLAGGAVHVAEKPVTDKPVYRKVVKRIATPRPRPAVRSVPRRPVTAARSIPRRPAACYPIGTPEAAASPTLACQEELALASDPIGTTGPLPVSGEPPLIEFPSEPPVRPVPPAPIVPGIPVPAPPMMTLFGLAALAILFLRRSPVGALAAR